MWDYPDLVVLGENSLVNYSSRVYSLARPYSHAISATAITVLIVILAFNPITLFANGVTNTLVEGVVMGIDANGQIQEIDTVTPLIAPKFQLTADLLELIYQPMLRINSAGQPEYILASEINPTKEGTAGYDYTIKLRQDVYWHDGSRFNADDVIETFNKIVELNAESLGDLRISANRAEALSQMIIEKIDQYTVRMAIKQTDANSKTLFPNFLELITFRVMPARYLAEITPNTVSSKESFLNRKPLGTGPFKFDTGNNDQIRLRRFDSYYLKKPNIQAIEFKLYKTEDALVNALKNGEVHAFMSNTSKHVRDLERYPKIQEHESNILTTQYWALYFNLNNGTEYLKDVKVRQALAQSINYDYLLQAILGKGERAYGPIAAKSEYFNANAGWLNYDPDAAKTKLKDAGWTLNSAQKLVKDGKELVINIKYVDHFDRERIINSIKQDWESIGIVVQTEPYTLARIKDEFLLSGAFDLIMYGMGTFYDPDRFELFHSNAINFPGLNISGYKSTATTKKIVSRKLVDVPKSDRALEIGRSVLEKNIRQQEYNEFQQLIAADVPAVFLYHPAYNYYAVDTLKGVKLDNVTSIESRFISIADWYLE